ncbi:hypothetical protein JCM24511_07098 [Saitozyma sp. JCM 24511]|nr:hypothetical protein JCM24511_07098 [Saitozyma sp. JCM 24511]
MASRAVPPHLDGASPRDRERGSRYGDDRSPRKGAGAGRDRSRSPRRDRYDDRDTTEIVLIDTTGLVMTTETDRKRTSHTAETENANVNENENVIESTIVVTLPRELLLLDLNRMLGTQGRAMDATPETPEMMEGPVTGGSTREKHPADPPPSLLEDRGPRLPLPLPLPVREGTRGGREREYDRPLDRRAIEEGRRRREEERARGVVYTDDGKVVPAEETPDVSASASPFPEGADEDEEGGMDPAMAAMMGFGGFTTTKGKSVGPNADGGANVHKQRTWRQYMNRRGGFNRPLEKMK